MTTKLSAEQSSPKMTSIEADVFRMMAQAFGSDHPKRESLDNALYEGIRPIVTDMRNGALTEEQGSLLIQLLVSAYTEAAINIQLESLFQGWAERLVGNDLGEAHGRK